MLEPDDFRNNWYGWLTNQCGHIVFGIAVSLIAPSFEPVAAAFMYWTVVEFWMQRNKLWRDSIMDTFFVMAGGSLFPAYDLSIAHAWGVAAITAVMLGFGVWKRLIL